MPSYINRTELLNKFNLDCRTAQERYKALIDAPTVDVVEVVPGYRVGDACVYGFGSKNKSSALVEIVKILNDQRGVAEVKFLKVFVDDTGNGLFDYLLKSGGTMNASFEYLRNITPVYGGRLFDLKTE